jgi:glycosyltransferase involved in cell wall biosynthesis
MIEVERKPSSGATLMLILMISHDRSMLTEGVPESGDTRERHIKYAKALRRRYPGGGITVVLRAPLSWSSQPQELVKGLTVHPVPCRRWAFAAKAKTLLTKLASTQRFDLTTTHTPFDDGYVGIWLKRHFGIPLNVQMRSSFLDIPYWINERPITYRVFNHLGKWVAHRADTIRVVSQREKLRLEKLFPGLRDRVITLHPLVNTRIFEDPLRESEREHVKAVLAQHGLHGRPFVLFVGRLAIQKNIPTLLQAFARARQGVPEASLAVAGDGPLRVRLEQMARQWRLNGSILWLGAVPLPELRGWYAEARATVLPSFHEGLVKVIIESYLMGTPVIATPVVSASELIRDGQTGFIAPDFTSREWLAQRMALLLTHRDRAKAMGQAGRRLMRNYLLDEEHYMRRLVEIWEQTARKRPVRDPAR